MEIIDFNRLFQLRGGYSLPVLVELYHAGNPVQESWHLTSSIDEIEFEGDIYEPATMTYTPPTMQDGIPAGGSLEMAVEDNDLLNWLEAADEKVKITVKAVINDGGEIRKIGQAKHEYGRVVWNSERIVWSLAENERLQMQINPWTLTSDLLMG